MLLKVMKTERVFAIGTALLMLLFSACGESDSGSSANTDTADSDSDADTDSDSDTDTDSDSDTDTDSDSDTDTDSDNDIDTDTDTDSDIDTDTNSTEPALHKIVFTESMNAFPNPERGFHKFNSLTAPSGLNGMRAENRTLIYGKIDASAFRNATLSADFLAKIRAGFQLARSAGIKVNPRVVYTEAIGTPDAPLSVVLEHIGQLAPLWAENKDVINVLDPGFIGAWGEWHSSTNNLDSEENMNTILDALLANLPPDRMILVRQPLFKRRYLSLPGDTNAVIKPSEAFSGTAVARIGHLNDCFLSSSTDVGTYSIWSLADELTYLSKESLYVPWGGETCASHVRNDCPNALAEMEKIHVNYLNRDYNGDVITKWKTGGCYDEIERRLGYRFVLTEASMPDEIAPGGLLNLSFAIKNVGFGELFNPRNMEVVLIHNVSGEESVATLSRDPRFFRAGSISDVDVRLSVPVAIAEGAYTVGIRMPDISASIHDDVRYAIRFANEAVWNEEKGTNVLKTDLQISLMAPGIVNNAFTKWREIP